MLFFVLESQIKITVLYPNKRYNPTDLEGMVHARVRHSVLKCNVFKTKLAKWPFLAMDARILLADAISKPSHCYGCMRGVLGHAAIGLSTACNAFGEQETCTRRFRRNCAPGYPSGAPKACTSSVGLPSPHKQPKETCPRLIWPF